MNFQKRTEVMLISLFKENSIADTKPDKNITRKEIIGKIFLISRHVKSSTKYYDVSSREGKRSPVK